MALPGKQCLEILAPSCAKTISCLSHSDMYIAYDSVTYMSGQSTSGTTLYRNSPFGWLLTQQSRDEQHCCMQCIILFPLTSPSCSHHDQKEAKHLSKALDSALTNMLLVIKREYLLKALDSALSNMLLVINREHLSKVFDSALTNMLLVIKRQYLSKALDSALTNMLLCIMYSLWRC